MIYNSLFSSQIELHPAPKIDFFAKLWLIFSQLELWRTELPKCTPSILMEKCDHTILPVLSALFLYDPACKAWLFEKFILELKASYSFKITCFLVRQAISLKKNAGIISKTDCLVSWSSIYTPLILVSPLVKRASISTTVIYNSMRVDTSAKLLI